MRFYHGVVAFFSLLSLPVAERTAAACGGCFAPTDTVTNVDAHRMVISLSVERTTLWDQIRYSGNPADFVWVLPVPSGAAEVELADPAFFDELDAQTAPVIQGPFPPQTFCDSGGGIGCGDSAGDSAPDQPPEDGVTVYSEETIGPYETVVIGSEDTAALGTWLANNGYRVPAATLPIIDYYVSLGSEFVVLRLSPGVGVQAMQPVRVRYPGYMASFPLRMVAVGAQGVLELSLWIFADQRFESANYASVEIAASDLVWDWASNRSNYDDAFDAAIDRAGGRAWVVEHAGPLAELWFSDAAQGDLATATTGLSSYPALTRLRTRMLVDHLGEDLELRPAASVDPVSHFLTTTRELNRPPDPDCGDDDRRACAIGVGHRARGALLSLAAAALALVMLRRRK